MKLPVKQKIAHSAVALAVCGAAGLWAGPALAGLHIPFFGGKKAAAPVASAAGADGLELAPAAPAMTPAVSGPAADYPVVLGQPYRVGDRVFTPVNAMNYDAVGYAAVGGPEMGVSAAHHTLPLPSYVEITSLASGRTILVRVERRGPMDSTHAIELSPAAAQQLGIGADGRAAIRVRRVNPLETERAVLRAGGTVAERMATPKPLLAVLQRRMATDPAAGHAGALLSSAALVGAPQDENEDEDAPVKAVRGPALAAKVAAPKVGPKFAAVQPVGVRPVSGPPVAGAAFTPDYAAKVVSYSAPKTVAAKVVKPVAPAAKVIGEPAPYSAASFTAALGNKAKPLGKRAPVALAVPSREEDEEVLPLSSAKSAGGKLVVQVGAFSDKARAGLVAQRAGARLAGAGNLWRVRMGPFSSRGEAEAALAKARAAGYSEARIQHGD